MLIVVGCGASTHAASVLITEQLRDFEDYSLEPIQLQVTNIEEFDIVFGRLQDLLNRLVELNNGVNEAVAEVKSAYAAASGVYEVETSIGRSSDVVLVDLFSYPKGKGIRLKPEEVLQMLENEDMRNADVELECARIELNDMLASSEAQLLVRTTRDGTAIEQPDVAEANAPAQLQKFNTCLARLRTLLWTKGYLQVTVKPALAFGTKTVRAKLFRRVRGVVGSSAGETKESVPVMVACSTSSGESIKEAEAFLIDRAQHLALRTKGMGGLDWHIVSGYKVVLGAPEAISNDDTRDQVMSILQAVNVALFKLLNAGASIKAPASLSNAVVEVVKPMLELLRKKHTSLEAQDLRSLISVQPAVEFHKEDDGSPPTFDFKLNVELTGQAGIPPFPHCLPDKASILLSALDHLKITVAEALLDLPPISEDVDVSLEDAKEFYELCPDAAARKGLTMMEAVKSSKATGSNLRTLYSTQELFLAFGENVKRVTDDFAASTGEVEQLLNNML